MAGMDGQYVIAKLREHEPELRAAGIAHLRLHGSLARGTATATSDVDLIADFDGSRHLSLLDMVGLENRLSLRPPRGARRPVPGAYVEAAIANRAAHKAVIAS